MMPVEFLASCLISICSLETSAKRNLSIINVGNISADRDIIYLYALLNNFFERPREAVLPYSKSGLFLDVRKMQEIEGVGRVKQGN